MGVVNNALPFTLIIWAQTYIASGLAAILVATTPLFSVVLAGFTLSDERITALRLIGVTIGFAGIVLVIGMEAVHGFGEEIVAALACLAGACCFALGNPRFAVSREITLHYDTHEDLVFVGTNLRCTHENF